jgi:crotonobetainyl-CoA:carnitine CoA-transferase CaiB-like acyl-CoA transferase
MTAFQGVRILDCTQGLAGPLASMLMADFGAEVLKIEPPEGDRAKHEPGYLMWNRNKRRLTLDLADEGDRARFDELAAAADIAVFDHSPRSIAALGLDAGALTARHPRLVHLWMPPYGTTGAWSELPSHHAMLTGLTGSAFRQGSYADQPVWHVAQIVHHAQGILGASAAGAALIQRGRDGRGRSVVVSGLHAMAETGCPVAHVGVPAMVRGRPLGGSPSYRLYQCGDGHWLFLATLFSYFFQRALKALELDGPPPGMDMGEAIQAKLRTQPRAHWLALFRAHDVPAGPVEHREDFLQSEIAIANDLRAELVHPTVGRVVMVGVPARLHETPGSVRQLIEDATDDDVAAFTAPRAIPNELEPRSGPPLQGVKVLDLGSVIAGTYAATILANFGAEVVKVESRDGDPFRNSMGFVNYNRGKRGLGVDLKSEAGRATFIEMARQADAVVDNYRLGVRERLGIDYAALAPVNPRLVSCSINTYGSKGSEAHLPGFDPLLQARSGLMWAQGGDAGEPVFHSIAVNDVATAAMGAFAIIAALHAREITGRGQNAETSLAAQSALYQSGDLTWYEGRPPMRKGARDCLGFAALDRFYACVDGWLTLACTTGSHFEALARTLGHPDWLQRWSGEAALAEPRDGPLADEIAAALADRPRAETVDALFEAGVPAARVMRADEAHHTEYFWENGFLELRSHPLEGELITGRGFATFDGEPLRFDRLHPELGEHGVEVLLDYGVPREKIIELAQEGVIFRA